MCKQCDDGNHEFVGMDLCIYCNEPKGLVLQTRFNQNGKPMKGVSKEQYTSPEPCDDCKKKFDEMGVYPMIEGHPDERTGQPVFGNRYTFIRKEGVVGEDFKRFAEKNGFLICDEETMDKIFKEHTNG